jgi:hypothetical protein
MTYILPALFYGFILNLLFFVLMSVLWKKLLNEKSKPISVTGRGGLWVERRLESHIVQRIALETATSLTALRADRSLPSESYSNTHFSE